jgi:Secretion system C-terminal sorting domain
MKKKIYILATIAFSFFEIANAQTPAVTADFVALPTSVNTGCVVSGPTFAQPANYTPTPAGVQLGVNNTGTDICQLFGGSKVFQAMVWDNVTTYVSPTNFTSNVYLSWGWDGLQIGSYLFPIPAGESGGFDPDVAIFSDSSGTFLEIVFENNTTGKIDGYTFSFNGTTFIPATILPFKSTLSHDATKKAKNPNIAAAKNPGAIAVVWHEEGLVNPPQTLTITYSTTPPTTYTNTVSILQSKVYIYGIDKPGDTGGLLGSPTSLIRNFIGTEVIRTAPANSFHLFDRNFNPDVSFSEDHPLNSVLRGISVVFLSQWFDPSTFSIVTGQLSVVQGVIKEFDGTTGSGIATTTVNFTTPFSGKPRIASRLLYTGINVTKDFSVVMGNSVLNLPPCPGGTSQLSSKIHNWWFQTGGTISPVGGVDLLSNTSYATSTAVDPVISCINGKGFYNVTFSAINNVNNALDIVANTYKEGVLVTTAGPFSLVNYGTCGATTIKNQVLPSVASTLLTGQGSGDYAFTSYLFWDQNTKTLDYKKSINNIAPGTGIGLKLAQPQFISDFTCYPNPTDNEILFDFKLAKNEVPSEIEIFNIKGQSVDKFSIEEDLSQQRRNVNKIPSGLYIAILKTNVKEYKIEFIKK